MAEEIKTDVKLNLEGLMCPMPIVRVSKAIQDINLGAVIEATATDPGVLIDIPSWARTSGNEVIKIEREGKIVHFFVRRLK